LSTKGGRTTYRKMGKPDLRIWRGAQNRGGGVAGMKRVCPDQGGRKKQQQHLRWKTGGVFGKERMPVLKHWRKLGKKRSALGKSRLNTPSRTQASRGQAAGKTWKQVLQAKKGERVMPSNEKESRASHKAAVNFGKGTAQNEKGGRPIEKREEKKFHRGKWALIMPG